jgi:hypothetical protein
MILVHLIEKNDQVIGACVEGRASGDQVFVTVDEAKQLVNNTTQGEWDTAEAVDVRNLAIRPNNSSPRFRELIKEA